MTFVSQHERESLNRERLLQKQLDQANLQIVRLTDEVARLSILVAQRNERITELLAIAQRKGRSGRSKKPTSAPPPPPTLDDEARKAYENRPKAPVRPPRKQKPKTKQRPTGRKQVPEHLEAEEHTVEPEQCTECGAVDLELVDEVVEIKLHVVKEHQRQRVVRRKTCRCRHCGTRTTARSLPSPFARSKATCEWLAWLVHQKFSMLVPLDRIRRDLLSRGIKLAPSYFVTQIERAADLLAPIDGEHWKQLLTSQWMATDATGLKVLIPKLPGSHQGYLEIFRNDETVVFQYEPHKGSEELVSKLKPFEGVLVADAEHRHNGVFKDGRVLEAGCNAHGRRKLRDAENAQPALAKEGGDFISAIYIAEGEAHKKELKGAELLAWRQERIRPLYDELSAWMDSVEPTLIPSDPLAKVIRYYRNHWVALTRCLDHAEIPIDNSASEREYQNVAKLRLNSLFAGSSEGAHRMATLLGIVATCKAHEVNPEEYLCWVFTRLGTHRDVYGLSAAELTPAAYAKSLQDSGDT